MESKITVLKFGSSVLRSEADLPLAVHEIYRHWRKGKQVLAVVSALGNTTDRLLKQAQNICEEPNRAALAALLATGEATSAALLNLSLQKAGIRAKILNPAQVGLRTAGNAIDAEPVAANVQKLRAELENAVVVVSGFVGLSGDGDLTLLGRGGSDFTALFLSKELNADCILVKDVAGLYESDPAESFSFTRRFVRANWQTALAAGGELVQPKAVNFAQKHALKFSITAQNAVVSTEICSESDKFARLENERKPLKITLLGCGNVGGGVYQRIAALPEFFEIVGVAERHAEKARAAGVAEHLLTKNAAELIEKDCHAVVELFGKIEPTRDLVKYALQLGRNVVSANKALFAAEGVRLERLARERGAKVLYNAAVGGALPALEIVSLAEFSNNLKSFSGILNGTCNFICDRLAGGASFAEAVIAAQTAGFAEADPTLDVNGTDAAQKLILLARAAFGVNLSLKDVDRKGIENLSPEHLKQALEKGRAIRLIAECRKSAGGFEASVKPVELLASHPFAKTRGAENCLRLERADGRVKFVRGRGAGRWATTEAVLADLFDLWRENSDVKRELKFAAGAEVAR